MGSKKIRKLVAKFDLGHQVGKKLGLPDPSGDLLYGSDKALSPAEQAQKNAMDMAKQQARQAEEAANMQLQAANEASQQTASQIQLSQDRQNAQEQLVDASQQVTERPTVQLAADDDIAPATSTRKKFRGQIGGKSSGASVRV
jgi:hypothetical protein